MTDFLGVGLIYWFFVCLAIAVLYFMYWPKPKGKSKLAFLVLRYGHSAVWIFIALALLNYIYGSSRALSDLFGYMAFGFYGLFLGMLLHDRWKHRN